MNGLRKTQTTRRPHDGGINEGAYKLYLLPAYSNDWNGSERTIAAVPLGLSRGWTMDAFVQFFWAWAGDGCCHNSLFFGIHRLWLSFGVRASLYSLLAFVISFLRHPPGGCAFPGITDSSLTLLTCLLFCVPITLPTHTTYGLVSTQQLE